MSEQEEYGPQNPACDTLHAQKYRLPNEAFSEAGARQTAAMADNEEHRQSYKKILLNQRFMPAGRVQAAMGSPREVTAYNCFVSGAIEDSMESIMERATQAAETMRRGGGIGLTLVGYGLVVTGLLVLIVPLVALLVSWGFLMQFVKQ